jgi:Cysteine-rich CPXCG
MRLADSEAEQSRGATETSRDMKQNYGHFLRRWAEKSPQFAIHHDEARIVLALPFECAGIDKMLVGCMVGNRCGSVAQGDRMKDEASYVCDSCGEEIVLPIDLSAGSEQEYVEDCPVCCCPNLIHIEIDEDGDVRVWAQRE